MSRTVESKSPPKLFHNGVQVATVLTPWQRELLHTNLEKLLHQGEHLGALYALTESATLLGGVGALSDSLPAIVASCATSLHRVHDGLTQEHEVSSSLIQEALAASSLTEVLVRLLVRSHVW